ncbi:unannotated protein [freshwater metagenome]|uniref:Unannotated protein n=1 Tax=freshwater metagenome TaxID=449393 RepID=A0A6J7GG84_9ZZZZ
MLDGRTSTLANAEIPARVRSPRALVLASRPSGTLPPKSSTGWKVSDCDGAANFTVTSAGSAPTRASVIAPALLAVNHG